MAGTPASHASSVASSVRDMLKKQGIGSADSKKPTRSKEKARKIRKGRKKAERVKSAKSFARKVQKANFPASSVGDLSRKSGDAKKALRKMSRTGIDNRAHVNAVEEKRKEDAAKRGKHKKKQKAKLVNPAQVPHKNVDIFSKCSQWWSVTGEAGDIVVGRKKALHGSHLLQRGSVELSNWQDSVEQLFETDVRRFGPESRSAGGHKGDQRWLRTVMRGGTLTDRVAAMTLTIQSSPVYGIKVLEALTTMAEKNNQRESGLAITALKDLYVNNLLPPHRRLKYLHEQPLLHGNVSETHKKAFFFEDKLKHCFNKLVQVLEKGSNNNLDFFKSKCIRIAHELLCERPEGEQSLLALLVNKLGDPARKIAGKATHQLVLLHPNMRHVVTREIDQLLTRPGLAERARYFAILFLNQMTFSHVDQDLARHLVVLYFSMFKRYVANKEASLATRLLSALLTGVNRAFPFAGLTYSEFGEHLDTLFRVAHVGSLNTAVQALTFIFQIVSSQQKIDSETTSVDQNKTDHSSSTDGTNESKNESKNESNDDEGLLTKLTDRFYRTLYNKLLSPAVQQSGKHKLLLNLLFRSIKFDSNTGRKNALIKRLLQSSSHGSAPLVCGSLYLISAVMAAQPDVIRLFENPTIISEGDGEDNDTYDPKKRDPKWANAENSKIWEMSLLRTHFHPSAVAFSEQLLGSKSGIRYNGDPLLDFTLGTFLDRFVYRQPKNIEARRGDSERQQIRTQAQREMTARPAVNSERFLRQRVGDVRPDEAFLYRYFSQKEKLDINSGKKSRTCNEEGNLNADALTDHAIPDEQEEAFAKELAENLMKDDIDNADDDAEFDLGGLYSDDDDNDDTNADADFDDNVFDDLETEDFQDESEDDQMENKGRKMKNSSKASLYASAEEFASILNEEESSGQKKERKHFDSKTMTHIPGQHRGRKRNKRHNGGGRSKRRKR